MAKKHEFFNECLSENELAAQIAAFSAFTEGMQLFSSFVMLLNFPRNGLLKGMGQIIAWSIADETLHTESMTMLFREYIKQNPQLWNDELKARIYSIAETMVDLEDRFIELAFGVCIRFLGLRHTTCPFGHGIGIGLGSRRAGTE